MRHDEEEKGDYCHHRKQKYPSCLPSDLPLRPHKLKRGDDHYRDKNVKDKYPEHETDRFSTPRVKPLPAMLTKVVSDFNENVSGPRHGHKCQEDENEGTNQAIEPT